MTEIYLHFYIVKQCFGDPRGQRQEPRVRDFEYHPPRPHEMTVGVKVYYENGAAADDDDEYNLELEPQPEAGECAHRNVSKCM